MISLLMLLAQLPFPGPGTVGSHAGGGGGGATITYQTAGSGSQVVTSGSSVQITGLTWTPGELVVVTATIATGVTMAIASSPSQTWTPGAAYNPGGSNWQVKTWWAIIGTGGSASVTVSGGSGYWVAAAVAYTSSTGWPAAPVDISTTSTGSGTTASISAGPTTQNVEVVVSQMGTQTGPATFTSGWNRRFYIDTNSTSVFDRILSSTESPSVSGTVTTGFWEATMMSFKPNP